MSTHPNVILLALLTPAETSRKTMRDICTEMGVSDDDDHDVKIDGKDYHRFVFEDDYNDDWQIGGKEGDLAFFDLVTYGYGEHISWVDLEAQKVVLEQWAKDICLRHKCSYEIRVTANYW